jgi:hypothetical protein
MKRKAHKRPSKERYMRKLVPLAALAAVVAATAPSTASAATCVALTCSFVPGDDEFETSGDTIPPIEGPVSATIGRTGIGTGIFEDTYSFIVDVAGFGSGIVSTSFSVETGDDSQNVDFLSVTFNGQVVPITGQFSTLETAGLAGVLIAPGVTNTLVIRGESRGLGSYGGDLTFAPTPVPEPATWGMMLLGFGGLGYIIRRRRQSAAYKQAFA